MQKSPRSKILIVEDSPFVRTIMGVILREYELFFAGGECEARRLFDETPDLCMVISDCQLEDGDGLKFLQAVRRERGIPVLLISGSFIPPMDVPVPFLAKPFYPKQLRDLVEELSSSAQAGMAS